MHKFISALLALALLGTALKAPAQEAADTPETAPLDTAESTLQAAATAGAEAIQKTAKEAQEGIQQAANEAGAAIQGLTEELKREREAAQSEREAAQSERVALAAEKAEWEAIKNGRKRIAMVRFPCLSATYTVGDQTILAATIADNLLSDFNQYFLQSTKFRVLSRQDNEAISEEQLAILNSAAASGNDEELCKLTKRLGLDYILAGTLKQFHIAPPQVMTIALTGAQVTFIPSAMMELDYRIVDIATTEIVWADHIIFDLTQQEINAIGNDAVTLYHTLCQMASRRIAEAMDALAPIRVLRVLPDGTFVLDRGGTLMIPGSIFDICRQGEPLLDPVSGEELGRPEYRLCQVQITQAPPTARFSYARIFQGSVAITPEDLAAGLIARPSDIVPEAAEQPANPPAALPAGKPGVKLPFDP